MTDSRLNAVTRMLSTTTQLSAKTTVYGAALSAIYLISSGTTVESLPPSLTQIAGRLDVQALGSLIDHMANGHAPNEARIRTIVLSAVNESSIEDVLTNMERPQLSELIRLTYLNILHAAIEANQKTVAERLLDQSEQVALLRDELPKLRERVQNITVGGDVNAGIAVIGGSMQVDGDLTINVNTRPSPDGYMANQYFKVFLSAPGDVGEERSIVRDVLSHMNANYASKQITIELITRHNHSLTDTLLPPSGNVLPDLAMAYDIVIVILWSQMGHPLVEEQITGSVSYSSITERDFWNAIEGNKKTGNKPRVLLYRRTKQVFFSPDDHAFEDQLAQYQRLKDFFVTAYADNTFEHPPIHYETTHEFRNDVYDRLEEAIIDLSKEKRQQPSASNPPATSLPTWQGSPFPGLRSFTPRDANIFFGRGTETDQLTQLVRGQRFVAVVGASGSGKSSLVGAGLIPRLRQGEDIHGSDAWHLPDYNPETETWTGLRFTPNEQADENPFYALADQLTRTHILTDKRGAVAKQLQQSPSYLAQALADAHPDTTFLMFVDQFEEMFTVIEARYRRPFMDMLIATSNANNLRVIVTVRADFLHRFIAYGRLNTLLNDGMFTLAAPQPGALYQMITYPAQRAGLTYDDGLPGQILHDTGTEPGGLALLAYALDELYHRAKDGKITSKVYADLGGVQGAIGKRAEEAFQQLDGTDEHKAELLGWVFRDLVSVDERGVATRQRWIVQRDERQPDIAEMIDAFVDARLLVRSHEALEVAHEALLREWDKLKEWIERNRDELYAKAVQNMQDQRLLYQLRNAARAWNYGDTDLLWLDTNQVELTQSMLDRVNPSLNPLESAFINPPAEYWIEQLHQINISTSHLTRYNIGERLADIGDTRPGVGLRPDGLPDMVWCDVDVPNDLRGQKIPFKDEDGNVYGAFALAPFKIAKYLVTHQQFEAFINADDGFDSKDWWDGMGEYVQQEMKSAAHAAPNAPRDSVSWYQAVAFTRWLTAKYRDAGLIDAEQEIRLPTEWEWQWAAQNGTDEHEYPWGDWDDHPRANTTEAGIQNRSTAVGMYPHGAANCGTLDMAGNLWEWCLNKYDDPNHTSIDKSNSRRAQRGGSFNHGAGLARCAYRNPSSPPSRNNDDGFRCVVASPIN